MTRAEKKEVIEYLTSEFQACAGVIVCDYKGLTVRQLEAVRKKARAAQAKVQIAKNTLASIALNASGIENPELKDTNVFLWSDDQVSLAKLAVECAKDFEKKFVVKSGFVDGAAVSADQIEAISKLPSREELIGMLLSVWNAPLRNMATVLSAPLRDMVTVLDNYKNTKE